MTRTRKGGRKRNPGWFKKGYDPRRSTYRFTAQDCRIGYWVAAILHPELREWLLMRIRIYYHQRSKHGPQENGGRDGCAAAGVEAGSAPGAISDGADDIPF